MERLTRARSLQGAALPPMVGRGQELRALKDAFEAALDGKGALWVLVGREKSGPAPTSRWRWRGRL